MRTRLPMLIASFLLLVACGVHADSPATQPAGKPVAFDIHDGYFVSNEFEPQAAASFVVIRNQKAFDEVFGTAMVMGDKSHRLPDNAFDTKIVVVAIKRGKAVWQFSVKEVIADNGVLSVRYTTTETKQDAAEFTCPLIVSVPKGDYTAVEFVEDGKSVKKLDMAPPATQPATDWIKLSADEAWYKDNPQPERIFTGTLEQHKEPDFTTLMRAQRYKLGNRYIFPGKENPVLEKLIGQKVEIKGKPHDEELEGQAVSEIWVAFIRPVAATTGN